MSFKEEFQNKSVLVTGACGTVGGELVRQVSDLGVKQLICIDNNETDLFFLQESYRQNPNIECYLVDIRDLDDLKHRMQGVDIVLHAAALKHVGLCEGSPNAAVRTNVEGVKNIIDAANANNVSRVIFTSSDKAVNPTNVMGTTKLLGERLMTAASENSSSSDTIFASTRFGNVLGSRGSVVPLFQRQIESGGPITLTDRNMTRFIMTLEEAAELVLKSVFQAVGGEVFITKMPVARIEDIAAIMVENHSSSDRIEITEIGIKPGEKLYEELMNTEEVRRTYEGNEFLIVLPAFCKDHAEKYPAVAKLSLAENEYNSSIEPEMMREELSTYLLENSVI